MIYIKNLYKSFKKHPVLTGLDLEVRKGQILVIVGRSGVGKSILLKLMLGLEKPDNGTIKILGKSITPKYTLVKDMGMVFQKNALFDSMNIFANIAFYLRYHGNKKNHKPYTEEEIKKKVFDALALVG
jgi:phospholipid/cholesterol/gamma-HCH transport system ATP-binding protein